MAASLALLGRAESAREYLQCYMDQVRRDMPHFPGENLDDWRPVLSRMLDYDDEADLDHLLDALKKAAGAD